MENKILKDLIYDTEKGGLFYKGVRYLLIRPEVLVTFQKEIEKDLGERAKSILFQSGFYGGMSSSKVYRDIYRFSEEETVHFMLEMGGQIGWGKFELDKFDLLNMELTIKVFSSPFAETYGKSEWPVCHFIRGVIAGLGSVIFGKEIDSGENACISMGDPFCRFEIKGKQ